MAPPHPASPPEPPILRTQDELLDEIFLRLPTAADLARASAACASFRRLITGHAFLRRYRALHPPPLIGVVDDTFIPAQPPHPSAVAARAFAGFDFSCSSFLPSTAGRTWMPIDFFDGRALLSSAPVEDESDGLEEVSYGLEEVSDFQYRKFLVRDLAVCDPVHRRYVLLPAVPGDLKALARRLELLDLETFLTPSGDAKDPLSFRVMCLAQCRMNIVLLVFSSLDGQWHALTFDEWGAPASFDSFEDPLDGLSNRQFVHGCFCWHSHFLDKLLLLDTRSMELSAVNLPPDQRRSCNFVIVEAAEGMLGMLAAGNNQDNEAGPFWLTYSLLRNNQWHSEKVIPLPAKYVALLLGGTGGYVLIQALYTTSSQKKLQFGFFSVDVKTLQVELFAEFGKTILPAQLYAGFPPSLCAPTI